MAVYTEISEEELKTFMADYGIDDVASFKGIAEGVENSNYLINTSDNKYILTLYEKRTRREDLPFYLSLMEHLAAKGVPCPLPIHDKKDKVLKELNGKAAAVVSFIEGKWPRNIKNYHCRELGRYLAKMHLASESFNGRRENNMSLPMWKKLMADTISGADSVKAGLAGELKSAFAEIEKRWPHDLPQGVIHADLFPDNVFFEDEKLSGLIDFYFSCNDFYAYDLAICLNAWCFEYHTDFNITKARHMLRAYNEERQFSKAELAALPILAAGASMRFLLSRLYDWLNQVEGALVTPKNPLDYLERLRFHLRVKNAAEYGLE